MAKCELFPGIYGAFMQLFLLAMTLLVLVGKNHFERKSGVNNRKCQEFFLDMLKQLFSAGLLHVFNFRTVVFHSSGAPLPVCQKYFLEIMMDTTVGIVVQWAIFKLVWLCLSRGLAEEYSQPFRRGQYYVEGVLQVGYFYKQLALWGACSILMKMTMLSVIHIFGGFLVPLVRFSLSGLDSYPHTELFVIMVVVPTVMNTVQFWVQDNFLQASNSNAPKAANTFDPWFCLQPESKYREHLKPLLPLFCCDTQKGAKGAGKGKAPAGPAPPGKGKGKGKPNGQDEGASKSEEQGRQPLKGPRPAADLKTRRNLKLHWKLIVPDEQLGTTTIWSKIRSQTTGGALPELSPEVLEQAFMERKQSGKKGGAAAKNPDAPHGDETANGGRKFRRSIKVHLITDIKEAFHMEIAYNQLEQKGMADLKVLTGTLGRRDTASSLGWADVLDHEKLETILKFLDLSVKYESVLTCDAVSETPFELFILKLVINCGALSTMKRRVEALLAKGRLQVVVEDLTHQYDRLQDNVHHIIYTSTKLPEILQYALQLGNYVNHGSQLGNAEAVDLNSLVTALGSAKCRAKPGDREMSVLKFLAKMLRKTRDDFWLGQLKKDLMSCCEARHVDPGAFSTQVKACYTDLQVIEKFAETAGAEDPPALSPKQLTDFIAATKKSIDALDVKKLDKDRKELLRYFALPDTEETTIPSVLESIAALHDELFGGQLHTVGTTFKIHSKMVKEDDSRLTVQDWLKEHKFAGLNDARIFFNPMATWVYPLHVAVMQKTPKVVKMLLEANADPTKTNLTASARELTPLRLAKYYESSFNFTSPLSKGAYTEVIKILEDAEAENSTWS